VDPVAGDATIIMTCLYVVPNKLILFSGGGVVGDLCCLNTVADDTTFVKSIEGLYIEN
jgi:hypothetical protein